MKRIFFVSMGLWIIFSMASCTTVHSSSDKSLFIARKRETGFFKPLSHCLAYPPKMQQANQQGVVVITFRLTEGKSLSHLKVHSQDKDLNQYLEKQLTGKLVLPESLADEGMYTVRLRLRLPSPTSASQLIFQ